MLTFFTSRPKTLCAQLCVLRSVSVHDLVGIFAIFKFARTHSGRTYNTYAHLPFWIINHMASWVHSLMAMHILGSRVCRLRCTMCVVACTVLQCWWVVNVFAYTLQHRRWKGRGGWGTYEILWTIIRLIMDKHRVLNAFCATQSCCTKCFRFA